jgi:hypothetical protein
MSAIRGPDHSRYAGLLPIEPSDDFFRPIDLKTEPIHLKPEDVPLPNWDPSARKSPRILARFPIAFCAGVAAAWLWQSYGDAAKQIATSYRQFAPRPALTAQNRPPTNVIAPVAPSAEQLNATSFDHDAAGQNDKIATTPTTEISVDQAPATKASNATVESDAASLQPAARLIEARSPQTLAEKGKSLSATSGHDSSCYASASAVLQNYPGGWPTWTLKAPGHEGTMCWYAAPRPRGSDHRSERVARKETVGTTENGLSAPPAPRPERWDLGLP